MWQNPVGTGPFMVKEWVPGSHLLLERNEYYWEEGKPYLDEVRMDYLPDDNARMLQIQGGEADIAEGVPFTQIEQIEGSEGITVEVDDDRGVGGRVPEPHEAALRRHQRPQSAELRDRQGSDQRGRLRRCRPRSRTT